MAHADGGVLERVLTPGRVHAVTWLVTGGAGYIGSHVVRAFRQVGLGVVVLDDLSSGHREFVPAEVPFVAGSVLDVDVVRGALAEHGVDGVVHLAGFKYAGVSVSRPLHTYEQNVTGTAHLGAVAAPKDKPGRHEPGEPEGGEGADHGNLRRAEMRGNDT